MRGTVRKMAPAQAVRMGSASPPVLIALVWQEVAKDGGGLWGLGLFHEDVLRICLPPLLYHHGAHVTSQKTRMCPQRQANSIPCLYVHREVIGYTLLTIITTCKWMLRAGNFDQNSPALEFLMLMETSKKGSPPSPRDITEGEDWVILFSRTLPI